MHKISIADMQQHTVLVGALNASASLVYGKFEGGRLVGSMRPVYGCVWGWDVLAFGAVPLAVIHGGADCGDSVADVVRYAQRVARLHGARYCARGGASGMGLVSMVSVHRRFFLESSALVHRVGAWVHNFAPLSGGVEFLPYRDALGAVHEAMVYDYEG